MRFGFDLDEVVVDLTSEIAVFLSSMYGINWPIECFAEYGIDKCKFNEDPEYNSEIIKSVTDTINDPLIQLEAKPIENAVEVLHKFKRMGHKLYYITHRPKQNQPLTYKWLRRNDIPFDELVMVDQSKQKGVWGMRYRLDMYVDDLQDNLKSMWNFKKRWRKGLLLFDRPWNSTYIDSSKFIRVMDWNGILRHVGIQNR